jgi:hypothetical protein
VVTRRNLRVVITTNYWTLVSSAALTGTGRPGSI